MTDRCARCGVDAEHHGADCRGVDIAYQKRLIAFAARADRGPGAENPVNVALDTVARAVYRDPYPPEWDIEEQPTVRSEWRVVHRRQGWKRARTTSRYYQKKFYALRRFRRLKRSSNRAGHSRVVELRLERREVGEWEVEKDIPWLR